MMRVIAGPSPPPRRGFASPVAVNARILSELDLPAAEASTSG
jgi:hypothetical protein